MTTYNIETGNYATMPRDALVYAAEHNRNSVAYWYKLFQEEWRKNLELQKTIAYLASVNRQAAEAEGMWMP